MDRPYSRRPLWLLALGACAGLALAGYGIGRAGGRRGLPDGAVARVNEVVLRDGAYHRRVELLEGDLGRAADADQRATVLDRMIEEELLVQRALELGLAAQDRRVRSGLIEALVASVTTEAEARNPDEATLQDFFAENRAFFTRGGRIRLRQIYFARTGDGGEAEAATRARAAHARIVAGEPFDAVRASGDPELPPVPDALLSAQKLADYVGPVVAVAASRLADGAVSEPIRSGVGWHVVRLVERDPAPPPAFEQVAEHVRAEWRRREGERALRAYLERLRDRADVAAVDPAP